MAPIIGAITFYMTRVIVYIDGFNLFHGLKSARQEHRWPNFYWLNLEALCESFVTHPKKLMAVKYFTARVRADPEKTRRQNAYIDALGTLTLVDVIEGRMQAHEGSCAHCNTTFKVWKEKKTDVNIAVSMVVDAHEDNFDEAILITGDTDLVAPIKAVKSAGKKIFVAAPPFRFTAELKSVSDGFFKITKSQLRDSQFDPVLFVGNGFKLSKPARWSK